MANIKAEVLASILADAETAKPVEGKENTYSPEEYNKLMYREQAMGLVNQPEYLESHIAPGSVEFYPDGRLKRIARNAPKMLDLNAYTANRYMVEKISEKDKEKREPGTYIVVVMGNAIVQAINNTAELPPTVKAYRFKRISKGATVTQEMVDANPEDGLKVGDTFEYVDWAYQGAEFIKDEVAYKMANQLNPDAMLKLRRQIDENPNPRLSDKVYGDSLDDIA